LACLQTRKKSKIQIRFTLDKRQPYYSGYLNASLVKNPNGLLLFKPWYENLTRKSDEFNVWADIIWIPTVLLYKANPSTDDI
jgi:hypothetical protein